jgi:GTP-binding protein HflX
MNKKPLVELQESIEKVLVVVVDFKQEKDSWSDEDQLNEMVELVKAGGAKVIEKLVCKLSKPTASTLIGEGKVNEIVNICEVSEIDTVIFSADLKGSQQRNLEKVIKAKTIDRTQLILDIFARHATSGEGKMQVELAQLEYLLPRLVGKGIELSRLGAGIGTLGPGETKLEVDRRRIGDRVTKLKRDLKDVARDRSLKRKRRKESGIPSISLVGYTNAGKSTLLNTLTDAGQITRNGLFTTLDSLSRQLILPNNQEVVLSDTVGFMHDLPHHLIEAFKATLEEVHEADMLLHVLDVSNPNFRNLYKSVVDVLEELDACEKPTVVVLNKMDQIEDSQWLRDFEGQFDHSICISAKEEINIDRLRDKIIELFSRLIVEIDIDIPTNRMDLVNVVHEHGNVHAIDYHKDRINIKAAVSHKIFGQLEKVRITLK